MRSPTMAALAFTIPALLARAQDTPAADVAVGYSIVDAVSRLSLTAEGGSTSVALNVKSWLGGVGDFALYRTSSVGLAAGTYTFGPRLSCRHWTKFTPFAQMLLGGVRYADNGFVFAGGAGSDIVLDKDGRFALRPQVDYLGVHAGAREQTRFASRPALCSESGKSHKLATEGT